MTSFEIDVPKLLARVFESPKATDPILRKLLLQSGMPLADMFICNKKHGTAVAKNKEELTKCVLSHQELVTFFSHYEALKDKIAFSNNKQKKKIIKEVQMFEQNDMFSFYSHYKELNDFEKNIKNESQSLVYAESYIKTQIDSLFIIMHDNGYMDENNKATCLSVLTEQDYFRGKAYDLAKIKLANINLPILCKDFFIDKWQIPFAKSHGADAILIILAGVSDDLASELYDEAMKYNMSVIVEVHTVEEAKKALNFKDALIGINNRNLKTLKTDINTTYDIYDIVKSHRGPLISESGLKNKDELLELNNKTSINTFLIGESLLKNLDKNSIFSVL